MAADPNKPRPLTLAVRELLQQVRQRELEGDRITAHRLLDWAEPQTRRAGSYHYARGALAFRLGDVTRAVEAFEHAVELEPEIAEFHANLGAALFERARRTGALEAGGENAPVHPDLLRAQQALERALSCGPKLACVFNNLGLVRMELGNLEGALEAFERALALEPGEVNALYNRAAVLCALDRQEDCLAALDRLLQLAPGFAPARASREALLKRHRG